VRRLHPTPSASRSGTDRGCRPSSNSRETAAFRYDGTSQRWRPLHSADLSAPSLVSLTLSSFLSLLGYADLAEIVTPADPAANVARLYVLDDSGVTRLALSRP
jgi:hypothetical protein